ncbi:hypothetical protein G6F65_019836 [Rhizopus arrhizus]|nr:hypothetical protein G6F65_019836 [Rhizopus arrhizus]
MHGERDLPRRVVVLQGQAAGKGVAVAGQVGGRRGLAVGIAERSPQEPVGGDLALCAKGQRRLPDAIPLVIRGAFALRPVRVQARPHAIAFAQERAFADKARAAHHAVHRGVRRMHLIGGAGELPVVRDAVQRVAVLFGRLDAALAASSRC